MNSPRVAIIGGINGAGKTTASRELLTSVLKIPVFTNADAIARGLNSLDPESEAFRAGRVMLDWVKDLINARRDFAFETTLSARTYASAILDWRKRGYRVYLYYYWLESAELAVSRIRQRVQAGGHHIPDLDVRRRYGRSVRNFLDLYKGLCDHWEVYDNSYGQSKLLAIGGCTESLIDTEESWSKFMEAGNDRNDS